MTTKKRSWLATLGLLGLLVALGLAGAPAAHAADGDSIPTWDQHYVVQTDGSVQVTETIDYQFGSAGRRGITRGLVIREPYSPDNNKDRVYRIENISVSSPTAGVPTTFTTSDQNTSGGESGRNKQKVIRIGDQDVRLSVTRATYVLRYTIRGALITENRGDQFYWDVIPTDASTPRIGALSVSVDLPNGATPLQPSCKQGAANSTTDCTANGTSNGANYAASNVGAGTGVTVFVGFPQGAVSDAQPILVDSAAVASRNAAIGIGAATGATSIASLVGVLLWWRRGARDERFIGVPPGLMPAPGQESTIGRDDKPEIPVQFSPPKISVGEAGMLDDGTVDVRDTTATLVDLAVRGAVQLSFEQNSSRSLVRLVDPSVAQLPHEQALMNDIFGPTAAPGYEVDLSSQGALTAAHADVTTNLRSMLADRGWYAKIPSRIQSGGGRQVLQIVGCLAVLGFMLPASVAVLGAAFVLIPLVPIIIALVVVGVKRAKGRRSALGRAVQDQVEGFRTYIATAEADQLKFEEGEDIFSRYLPWAIVFNLTQRWTSVCQQLVAEGRLQDTSPGWFYGPWYGFGYFNPMFMASGLDTASMPEPSTASSSGSGFSGFDGGGFVGGGGGGGSIGSW